MSQNICFNCGTEPFSLIPKLIVMDNKNWHFATDKEINGDLDKVSEQGFCKECAKRIEFVGIVE